MQSIRYLHGLDNAQCLQSNFLKYWFHFGTFDLVICLPLWQLVRRQRDAAYEFARRKASITSNADNGGWRQLSGCGDCDVPRRRRFVSFHMQCQVIRAGERSRTMPAAERFGPGVLADMTGQLVRTCKVPLTVREVTPVGFLTCMQNDNDC